MTSICAKGGMIVARYLDGRVVKGVTHDFSPGKSEFHVFEWGDESTEAQSLSIDRLKAIFFVHTFSGNKAHPEYKGFDRAKAPARKIRVRFKDGEILAGFTVGYSPQKQGFFVTPADPDSNNSRVYVVNRAVEKVEWA